MNQIKNVLIVAGGKNTRFKEMSIFPKVLLPMIQWPSILTYDVHKFTEQGTKVHLVINESYYEMVKDYVENNKIDVEIILSSNCNGSSNTLKSVKDKLPKEDTLVIWSDLVLSFDGIDKIFEDIVKTTEDYIVFTKDGKYRCRFTERGLVNVENTNDGNVPGIYYYKSIPPFAYDEENFPNLDLVEYLDAIPSIYSQTKQVGTIPYVGNITEFRDLTTYLKYYYDRPEFDQKKTRFFNSITLNEDMDGYKTIIKKCIDPSFNHLIDKEIDWYSKVANLNLTCIPKIRKTSKEEHMIEMEYLEDYYPVHIFLREAKKEELKDFFNSYFNAIEELHSIECKDVPKEDVTQDCEVEFYSKVLIRCNAIKHMLVNYNALDLDLTLSEATNIIINSGIMDKNYPYGKYWFTHGDLNGSNAMYNPETKEIKFIDPRGYFGKTIMSGLKEYDYAKVLYCLTGYDDFNLEPYVFTSKEYSEPKMLVNLEDLPEKLNNPILKLMVGIIWVSLAQYIAQDIFKANIAYNHGMKMLHNALVEYNERGEQQ